MKYIKKFQDITMDDIGLVGGKNASLGQMIRDLSSKEIPIPLGFAITTQAYKTFLTHNRLDVPLAQLFQQIITIDDTIALQTTGAQIRELILQGTWPEDVAQEIIKAYQELSRLYLQDNLDVAVRSSATAEDLPGASFAGQQSSFLHVQGNQILLERCKECLSSLFTDRAIAYRIEHGFAHDKVAISVGVQKMIRSDIGCAGVMFTLDTETGFQDVIIINATYGLGETLVQGKITPDEFRVHKTTLQDGYAPIIKKQLGDKLIKLVYNNTQLKEESVPQVEQQKFALNDEQVLALARMALIIEKLYSDRAASWIGMDIEWAFDGAENKVYIVQARPETIHSNTRNTHAKRYVLQAKQPVTLLVQGQSIGQQIATGTVRVIRDIKHADACKQGDVLVTDMTDPDWTPIIKRASAIITDRGGRTCHAAIISRELGIPAIIGTEFGTQVLHDGQVVTVDCSNGSTGMVYAGSVAYEQHDLVVARPAKLPVQVMVNCADPETAMTMSQLPVDGVGLARTEFIIAHNIKMHPMVACSPNKVRDSAILQRIERLAWGYPSLTEFFIETLSQGIGSIAAAFYPRPVIVRMSDFKTNEYRNLLGGSYFEHDEENPMIGLRGASRYYSSEYQPAFELECQAFKRVRTSMGFGNVKIMIPFVRTIGELGLVLEIMKSQGLERGKDGLEILMMCELPSNVVLIDEFSKYVDGFSIGSNDLTQLTLAVDRDARQLNSLFNERDQAVQKMLQMAVEGAVRNKKYSGICGQAPSDYPEIADALINWGIASISLNADSVAGFMSRF